MLGAAAVFLKFRVGYGILLQQFVSGNDALHIVKIDVIAMNFSGLQRLFTKRLFGVIGI
ncbi:hypothetical protein D3C76_1727740 [compost metagenome]